MEPAPVIVVGGGIAGLHAARRIVAAGHRAVVIEQGHAVGGRMATSRLAGARLDHGAQFVTSRSDEFAAAVNGWLAAGAAFEWCRGFDQPPQPPDGHPRYAGTGGMSELARAVAAGLDVRLDAQVTAVDQGTGSVTLARGVTVAACGVILTPPVARSLAMIDAGSTRLPAGVREDLEAIRYEPVLAALAVLNHPSAVPRPGGVQLTEGPFSFVADNRMKGISDRPAVTLHATGEVSSGRWHDPDPGVLAALLDEGGRWLGTDPVAAKLHRWRHARPAVLHPERCVAVDGRIPLALAGDAFGEPRVEGAVLSGWAAAAALLERIG